MHVPPGSIHLHKHIPLVLTSLSGSRQQARSGNLRARSWCWKLSGRNHFPANSLTWRELLTGLTTYLFQQQTPPSPGERSYTGSITTCTSQQATHNPALRGHHSESGIQTRASQTGSPMTVRSHGDGFSGLCDKQFLQGSTQTPRLQTERVNPAFQKRTQASRLSETEGVHGFSETNIGFSGSQECTRYSCRGWVDRTVQSSVHAQAVGWNGGGTPLMAHLGPFICMHQG
jgi:hypothetical protein